MSSLLPVLQKYLRNSNTALALSTTNSRRFVHAPQYDEQAGFGDPEAKFSAAELVESPMQAIAVGECSVAENQLGYFMDGIQRSWLLYYQDHAPVYYGYSSAVIRQRHKAIMTTYKARSEEALYVPFCFFDAAELAQLRSQHLAIVDTMLQSEDGDRPKQPAALREFARSAITSEREKLEADLAREWIDCDRDSWLVMDGSISISATTAECPRAIGLIKSHNTQYFDFPDQEIIFNLKTGERSSIFKPNSKNAVCSWYLRLRYNPNEDIHFGLLRVDAALSSIPKADEISRWLMTERRPLSLPDARWDKMIYPIRDCEQFLRSQEPSKASFGWLG